MRKFFLAGWCVFLFSACLVPATRAQLTSLTEGFDDVTTLAGAGWVITNNSNPLGTNNWAQGIPGNQLDGLGVNAQSGAANSFIQTNFNAANGGIASDWLITPVLELENGATISFYTQTNIPVNTMFPNELQVWESQTGSSTVNVGSTAASPGGDFTVKLLDINPGATAENGTPGGYPTTWTQYTLTISGLSAPTDGRIGFRYYLPDATTQGTTIGIDTFSFADPPTLFTRTVSGNWTDTTGWTPSGVPNGNTVTAQLVNPSSGTDTVDLGGGTFTLNQLQFSGTNSGTWSVINGTIIFDGTNPAFVNQGVSTGITGFLPNLQLNANTTFEIDNASVVTEVTGAISGSGELIKTGSGTLELAGTNTYTGGTVVNAGTLQLGDGTHTASLEGASGGTGSPGGAGTVAVTVNNSATFNVMTNATVTGGAGGAGSIVVGGNGGSGGNAVTFSAGGSLSNSGTISGGAGGAGGEGVGATGGAGGAGAAAVSFSSGGALTNGGTISGGNGGNGGLGNGGGSNTGGTGGTGGAAITFSSGGSLTNTGTISGGAGGAGGEGVGGTNGANGTDGYGVVFTGAAGTLTNLSGGHIDGGVSMDNFANAVTLEAGSVITGILNIGTSTTATLTLDGTGTQLYSTAVTGATTFNGALIKNGSGTWTLDQSFNYTGGTTINAGTLQIGNGGTAGSITGNVTDNDTLAFDRSDSVTFGGVVSGTGALVQMGSGTLILTLNNPFTGTTTINAGSTLQLGNGGTTGGVNSSSIIDNGVLVIDHNGDIFTYGGVVSGTGSGVKEGTGTLVLIAANTYTGGTTISGGTLQIGNGGTTGSIVGNVTDNAALVFDRSDNVTFSGAISGTGSLTQNGGGTLVLTGTNTYGGGTTISAGTLQIGSGSTSGSITGDVTDNGTLAFDRSDSVTFAGVISGTGGLVQLGIGGTLILTGTNTYTGGTTISDGILQLGNGGTSGSIVGNVSNSGVFAIDRSDKYIFSGNITGTGSFEQSGSGTTILSGANTYSGTTTVDSGTLEAGSTTAFSQSSAFVVDGVLDLHGFNTSIGSLTGTGSVTNNGSTAVILTLGNDNSNTIFSGILENGIIAALGLTKTGTGTLILTGNNTYTGGTTINAGTLALGSGGSIASSSGLTLAASGAGFDVSAGGNQTIQDLSGVAGSTINLGANTLTAGTADSTSFAGVISGTGAFTKQGGGTLTLSGANTYMGATTIDAGTLALGLGGSIVSSRGLTLAASGAGFDISAGGNQTIQDLSGVAGSTINLGANTLTAGTANSTSFAGVISGTGGLTKQGSGTLTLSGANTYLGATTVDAGTLALGLGGSIASSSGLTLFASGAGFDISAGGNQTIQDLNGVAGSTINLGANTLTAGTANSTSFAGVISGTGGLTKQGSGTLILNGNNTYTGVTTVNAGTLQIGNGGTSGSIAGNVLDNATFAFDRSDSITFGGLISGTGALVQMGSGTVTLTAENSYGGGTTIDTGASLQLGNDGPTGSIIGNVTDNGSLIFNRSGNVTFNAIISGSGNLVQNGSGTTVLGGANTYSGGTIINNGTLLVNNSQALGLGNVVVNGGVLGADHQPINVKGNYTQNAGGTSQLQVAGANPGQYDTLNVGGNATLGGTLELISLGFQPGAGNQLTLVTSGGTVSGQFAHFVDPFSVRPGLNIIDLIYGKQSVVLELLNQTTPVSPVIPTVPTVPTSPSVVPPTVIATINFASFALTPEELAAANLLDAVQLDPRAANLISFLNKEPFANLPGDFEKISPEGLTAFYEITFSNANIQRLNLESRLDDIRSGSNGFSSNMKVNGAAVNPDGKAGVDGKSSKGVVEPILQPGPENRWGVWATGFGDFVNVDGDANANGYDFTTGGFSLGIDYRISDQLAIGAMGEYSHTWTSLQPSGDIDVDSGRGGLYATWFNQGIYLNAAIYGGHNTYESRRASLGGLATGGTEGAEWSTFISGGYDLHFGHLSVGPIAALQYTYLNINGFSEKSSLAPLQIHSGSAESLRSDVGFRAFYQWKIGKILVESSLKAAWEHEYKYSALPITAGFAGIPGPSANLLWSERRTR